MTTIERSCESVFINNVIVKLENIAQPINQIYLNTQVPKIIIYFENFIITYIIINEKKLKKFIEEKTCRYVISFNEKVSKDDFLIAEIQKIAADNNVINESKFFKELSEMSDD